MTESSLFHNREAEIALVATALADPRAWVDCGHLTPLQFSHTGVRAIWRCLEIHNGDLSLDQLVQDLAALAGTKGESMLADLGGREALEQFVKGARAPEAAGQLAAVVGECAANRAIRRALLHGENLLSPTEEGLSARERIESLLSELDNIPLGPQGRGQSFVEGVQRFAQEMERVHANPGAILGLRLGLKGLDDLVVGLGPGDLLVIASNTGEGKSMLAGQIAVSLCTQPQDDGGIVKTAMCSLEMPPEQLAARFAFAKGRVDANRYRAGSLSPEEWSRLEAAKRWLVEQVVPSFVFRGGEVKELEDLAYEARHLVRDGVGCLVLDYIQRVRTRYRERRTEEIGDITSRLKELALALGIPIIGVSQVTRETTRDNGGRPRLTSLAESANLERDADYVLLLWRPEAHLSERVAVREHWQNVAILELAKGRHRPHALSFLRFDGALARFDDLDQPTVTKLRSRLSDLEVVPRKRKDD